MAEPDPSKYTAASLEVLKGLDPVRKRPGMYTDTQRPNHLAREVIDNSVDEAVAGHAKKVEVTVHADGSVTVVDDGRGMPVDKHPEEQVPGVQVILTKLHAGAKFGGKDYRFSGGLHGVGVSVVNALSTRLECRVRRDGKEHLISFRGGELDEKLHVVGKVGQRNTGTTIRFWPDGQYFDTSKLDLGRLQHTLRAKAVLCAGLLVKLHIEETGEKIEWQFEDGMPQYLIDQLDGAETLPETPWVEVVEGEEREVSWALCWLPEGEVVKESYVNLIPTLQGGTHVNGLRSGIVGALRKFAKAQGMLPKKLELAPADVWDRVCFLLSAKVEEPRFAGQTKERLGSREIVPFVSKAADDQFDLWLNDPGNLEVAKAIAQLAIDRAQARASAGAKVKRKRATGGPTLPGKLKDCTATDRMQTELFLVEGDSAGGSCRDAREPEFQAILPLRGKVLNTWEATTAKALSNQEVNDIAVAIGVEPGSAELSNLRYGKIIILADADSDGHHIATLLCALFLQHFRPLVRAGHIYVALPPLYRIDIGKDKPRYVLDEAEKDAVLREETRGRKATVMRFKGLGEMNAGQLRESTIHPDTRRLVRLTLDDEVETDATMNKLLAKKNASLRREWLEETAEDADLGVVKAASEGNGTALAEGAGA